MGLPRCRHHTSAELATRAGANLSASHPGWTGFSSLGYEDAKLDPSQACSCMGDRDTADAVHGPAASSLRSNPVACGPGRPAAQPHDMQVSIGAGVNTNRMAQRTASLSRTADADAYVNSAVRSITACDGAVLVPMPSATSSGYQHQTLGAPPLPATTTQSKAMQQRPIGHALQQPNSITGGCSSNESTTTAFLVCQESFADDEGQHRDHGDRCHSSRPTSLMHVQSYVYRPISYPDHISGDALAVSNSIMLRLTIPGNIKYKVVQYNSRWYHQGCRFGFTAFAMCLGSSYFQRLVAGMPHLEYAVRRSGPAYADYLDFMPQCSERRWAALHTQFGSQYGSSSQVTEESTLASIQFTCVYIACKLVDRMPMLEMLRYILTHLYGSMVSKAQTYDVEAKCLEGLGFRLGPYFQADDLEDDWPF